MKIYAPSVFKVSICALAFMLGTASSVHAQFIGPGALPEVTSLAQVFAKPVDDQPVRLQGRLVKQLSGDQYLFSDGRQEIRVEIDPKHLPAQPFGADVIVVIQGEVEKDFMESPEIDVKSVSIVR